MNTLRISHISEIKTNKEKLWKVISKSGNLNFCHPFCKENTVFKWGNSNSLDRIEYYSGLIYERCFFEWNDKLGYSLIIKKNNLSLAEVKWQIIPLKNDFCELLIQLDIIKNSLLKNYPNFLRWFIIKVIIKPKMKSYLKSVISGVGFYAETGIAVKKNQFGRNMIFS